MRKLVTGALAALCLGGSVLAAEPKIEEWNSYHSMGCMLLRECTDQVNAIKSSKDVLEYFDGPEAQEVQAEFDALVVLLNEIGVGVFIADSKYFPYRHRGAYHTPTNNFFLNRSYMEQPGALMVVTRHEGWHAVQDCMAGTIENSKIALVHSEDKVPGLWQLLGRSAYEKDSLPWEKEALWAGHTEGMTVKGLKACAAGEMWKVYKPTPLTRKFLVDEGYIKD